MIHPKDSSAHHRTADTAPVIRDVWSRTEKKYRLRASLLLMVNVVLFSGLGCFAYWLRSGVVFAPGMEDYWPELARVFYPRSDTTISLRTLLEYPISLEQVPLQIVILGLLLAALVSIPILVSVLYRFPAALPFVGVVGFLAMMPWLAIVLVGSCVLASLRPFRLPFRFVNGLLALVPVILYFFSASRHSAPAVSTMLNPADRIKFVAPWVLAMIASGVLMAAVLAIARWVNYRPGAITPLLAAFFATPAVLFEFHVGRDELHYRLLEHAYGPSSGYFAEHDLSDAYQQRLLERWQRYPPPRPSLAALDGVESVRWRLALDEIRYQEAAADAADGFCRQFPDSRYAVNAQYIKATALDMRMDLAAFTTHQTVRFESGFPSPASRRAWKTVLANAPDSSMALVARLRLAQLAARECDHAGAIELLRDLVARSAVGPADTESEVPSSILRTVPAGNSLEVSRSLTVLEGHRLLALLENNRDPLYGDVPLCGDSGDESTPTGFLRCDPYHPRYRDNLRSILDRFPDCQLADNIELELARTTASLPERQAQLRDLAERFPRGDGLPEIYYRLGEAYQQDGNTGAARQAFERVVGEFGGTVWGLHAEDRLRLLVPKPVEKTTS